MLLNLPDDIPYTSQIASPALTAHFLDEKHSLTEDPNWAAYGAETPSEYAHWALRSCGVVCVKMAVEGLLSLPPRSVMAWVKEGLDLDGYLTTIREDRPGEVVEIGWKHIALAALAERHGLAARLVADQTTADIARYVQSGAVLIASVSSQLGTDASITREGGHLVVMTGIQIEENQVTAMRLHNPSGRRADLQAHALIDVARFEAAFSGRGVLIQRKQSTRTAPPPPRGS